MVTGLDLVHNVFASIPEGHRVWSRCRSKVDPILHCLFCPPFRVSLNPVYTIQPVVKPVVQPVHNRFDNGLTNLLKRTDCSFNMVVKPVVQPGLTIDLRTVLNEQPLFVQPVVKPGCTTGFTTGYIHDTAVCQTGCQMGLTTG